MKPQTPFVVCCVFRWDGRAKERHTHTQRKKKTSVRFPKSSGFFSHASPQKLIFVLTKRRRRKRYLERKNTTTTTTTTTPGAPSSLRKRRIQVRGRGSDDRGSFFDAPPDAMIGDHDGYKWRKYGQKNIKSASYPRSYYRCTRPDCPARKQVENGVAKYENEHNHEKPSLLLHSQKTDLHRAKSGKVEKKKSKGAMMMSHARRMSSIFFFFFVDFLFWVSIVFRSIEMNKKTVRVLLTDRESRAQTSSIQSIDRSIDTKQDAHPECTRPATRKLKHRKRRGSFTKKRKME